jgi:hypothetical protein
MPRNGSGTYTRPQSDYVPGTTILATSVNSDLNDIAQALTASIARDGQTIPTANMPMGNFRHTGVADGTARTDYAALGQTQNGAFLWGGTAGGTANAATISLNPPLAAYAAGQAFRFQTGAAANTSAVTLNVNSLGAVAVNKGDGTAALAAGDLPASAMVTVVHDGTRFRLIDPAISPTLDGLTPAWVDLASATTTDLGTVTANVRITGTTTITAFGTAASGITRKLRFAGALTLTHNATSLILPGAANITTAAGDTAEAISLGSGNWVVVQYTPAAFWSWQLLEAPRVLSSVTQADFLLPTAYRRYRLTVQDIVPSNSVVLQARFSSDGGSTFLSTNSYINTGNETTAGPANNPFQLVSETSSRLSSQLQAASNPWDGTFEIAPGSGTLAARIRGTAIGVNLVPAWVLGSFSSAWGGTAARMNALRVFVPSGTFSGAIILEGLR